MKVTQVMRAKTKTLTLMNVDNTDRKKRQKPLQREERKRRRRIARIPWNRCKLHPYKAKNLCLLRHRFCCVWISAPLRRIGNARSEGCSIDKDARARTLAWLDGAAAPTANADPSRALVQLPRGNRPGAQSRHDDRRQQCGFDYRAHDRPPFCSGLVDRPALNSSIAAAIVT